MPDGQAWAFPKPLLTGFIGTDGGTVGPRPVVSNGHAVDELIASIAGCDDPRVIMTAAANIAGLMLLANYDLTEEELRGLLVSRPSLPARSAG